ncbi:hypothetical protein RHS01_09208 [Rhizoctonia solani]|uniref:Uncharacterized protein n=1 Tax=Rhizoctonia solani TaxID=456999 RepID=A0A8H7I4D5_9AGAM|nr:hypothetical protein RHS01_09208 [Rhizoctonia solani]
MENISQAIDSVKDGLSQLQHTQGPLTPEDQKPPAVEETPWAAPKAKPIGKASFSLGGPAPIISTGAPGATPLPSSTHTLPPPSLQDWLQPHKDLHQHLSSPQRSLQPPLPYGWTTQMPSKAKLAWRPNNG